MKGRIASRSSQPLVLADPVSQGIQDDNPDPHGARNRQPLVQPQPVILINCSCRLDRCHGRFHLVTFPSQALGAGTWEVYLTQTPGQGRPPKTYRPSCRSWLESMLHWAKLMNGPGRMPSTSVARAQKAMAATRARARSGIGVACTESLRYMKTTSRK